MQVFIFHLIPLPLKNMERIYDEDVCCCALNRIFGFKPKIALALISSTGSASQVFRMKGAELDSLFRMDAAARNMINTGTLYQAAKELDRLYSEGYSFTYFGADSYPRLLKECEDPPVGLYVRSVSAPSEIFDRRPAVAVVGTRDISEYGKEWCRKITSALSRSSPTPSIISGLALGTDIIAHETALENRARTVAVMATGIDMVYPARHRAAAERIANTPGCALVTDYPPGTAPLQVNFLRRNRIIAGLGSATVLIESRARGGGMLTARLAFSYSRDVYALPGRIDDARSQGCNLLIKEKIADTILTEKKLAENIGLKFREGLPYRDPSASVESAYGGKYGKDRIDRLSGIVLAIKGHRGITVEEIAAATGFDYKDVLEYTALLESDGIIYTDLMQRCFIRLK